MKITKERTGGVMTVALEGRLDSTGTLELEDTLWEDEKKQFQQSPYFQKETGALSYQNPDIEKKARIHQAITSLLMF